VCDEFLDVEALLSHYAPARKLAREHYRAHIDEADQDEGSAHPLIEGDEAFVASALEQLTPAAVIPRRYLRGPRPALDVILVAADPDALARGHERGCTLREIARHLGVDASTISRRLRRRRAQTGAATKWDLTPVAPQDLHGTAARLCFVVSRVFGSDASSTS